MTGTRCAGRSAWCSKPTPFPMSIYDNIAFGVKLYEKLNKNDMDDRVEWALKKAALWNGLKTS